MKVLDKIALAAFSVMMLLIAIIVCCIIFGWLDLGIVYQIGLHVIADKTSQNILLTVNIIFICLAIKAIFFDSSSQEEKFNEGILLENDDGKLVITKETIIGIVNGVLLEFLDVKDSQVRVKIDKEDNLSIILNMETTTDAIIKDLSNSLQIKIKEKIKESLDVDVKNVDIRVRSVVEPKTNSKN